MTQDIQDRVQGVMIGLAAGDRNGGPICMAVRLAKSLATQTQFSHHHILNAYLKWWQAGGFDTGPVAEKVFNLIASGIPYQEAVAIVDSQLKGLTGGCNPAHRSTPLAMAAFLADEHLADLAIQEAVLTHKHPLAGDIAAATVVLCRALIRGIGWKTSLHMAAGGRMVQTRLALQIDQRPPFQKGGFAPHVLSAAIYFVDKSTDFAEALDKSISFAGRANYCPVLVGAIAGARWGQSNIPQRAIAHCFILPDIRNLATFFAKQWLK